MEFAASGRLGLASILILLLLGSPATAQKPKKNSYLGNIELCNGADRTSLELRINACTALIGSREVTTSALATAHNNRGNAYVTKDDYDRAIQDFDEAIKLNPTDATVQQPWCNLLEEGRIR